MVQKPTPRHEKTIEARDIVKEFAEYYRESEFHRQRVEDYNTFIKINPQPKYVEDLLEPTANLWYRRNVLAYSPEKVYYHFNMTPQPENITLFQYNERKNIDKVYSIDLCQDDHNRWVVTGFYGRRGYNQKAFKVISTLNYATAKAAYDERIAAKKKGKYKETPPLDASGMLIPPVGLKQ